VAVAYAAAGAQVVATARTEGALTELDDEIRAAGGACTLVPLDLRDGDKVDGLGPTIWRRFGRLDVVVANAGILGTLTPLGDVSDKDWDAAVAVNLTANFRLIRSVDRLLRASPAGRAIFVTSSLAAKCKAYWGPYAITKAGLEALARTYANEVVATPVRVAIVDPGATRTGMRASAMPGEDPATLPSPESLVALFVQLASATSTVHGEVIRARG
jgi:NAD(P)-dependent dehydrogenase (short-subunit alcohol dehydrogenase family)